MEPMERSVRVGVLALLLAAGGPAFAGTQLAPRNAASSVDQDEERYPESRFGRAPASSVTKADDEGERDGAESPGQSRGPAGRSEKPSAARNTEVPTTPMDRAKSNSGVQEVALIAGDLGFFPKTVFVTRDVPVRMFVTGASKNTLCIMMDSFSVRKQIKAQRIEEIQFTPNVPGKYRFYCPVNGMEGVMIVKELASAN